MNRTPGPWRVGRAGAIVADVPIEGGVGGTSDTEYYGGHLIAETVAPCNAPILSAAPELLEACKAALPWVQKYVAQAHGDVEQIDGTFADRVAFAKLETAIAKAEPKS